MTTTSTDPGRKVGEVARATGLTVRTLHYYDEIGLLVASERSDAGHRLYTAVDVERLYRICLLRRLGLPLGDIAQALDDPAWDLRTAMVAHLGEVDRRIEATNRLRGRLNHLVGSMSAPDVSTTTDDRTTRPPVTDDLLDLLEEMIMLDTTVQRRISSLVYADVEKANDYLIRVFGLGPGELTRDGDGKVVHGELQVGDGVVWLHPESPEFDLASPATLGAATASMVVMVDDVDAHFRHASEQGATIRYEPVDQPYGYREYSALDSEGGLWSFMKPLD